MFAGMKTPRRPQRTYDPRLRELVRETGDPGIVADLGIPRSTVSGWLRSDPRPVVSIDVVQKVDTDLQREVLKLRRRIEILQALVQLLLAIVRLSGFRLDGERLPDGLDKARVLKAIEMARRVLPLRAVLRVMVISAARYHAWKRAENTCGLDDRTSCPRSVPGRLTADEVATIREMATSRDYRHMPTRTLALFAQRMGKVFVSPTTWAKLIRERGWRRPRRRIHPRKPRRGLRTSQPNEAWHIDTTVIRLLDGSKVYLHAVIDNFSRRILAWKVADKQRPVTTCEILTEAAREARIVSSGTPMVMADAGVENLNSAVDELIATGLLRRVLAQVDVRFSNSMIEAWWRSLKHQWLYLNPLNSLQDVRRLVAFYVDSHNTEMPHSAFQGQTPDEMYFGTAANIPERLALARETARQSRLEVNRHLECEACVGELGSSHRVDHTAA
ncbi:MAG: DDE-type integrase/transposase/recombinase [Myxococcota bacterium]|jgi:transposase InsO family protein|nr:DDE-type integrase/transposase/recombinase [Myxococcota bacterium]